MKWFHHTQEDERTKTWDKVGDMEKFETKHDIESLHDPKQNKRDLFIFKWQLMWRLWWFTWGDEDGCVGGARWQGDGGDSCGMVTVQVGDGGELKRVKFTKLTGMMRRIRG